MTRHEWLKYCIENKLCVSCHEPSDTGRQLCSECAGKQRHRMKARRDFYLAAGICPVCGINDIKGDEKSCPECRAKRAEYDRQRDNKKVYSYTKEKRKIWREQGRCVSCGAELTVYDKGHSTCSDCREKRRNVYAANESVRREKRTDQGECYICGSKDLADGQKLCVLCYKRTLKNTKKMWDARRKDGKHNATD